MEYPIFEFLLKDDSDHFTTAIVKDPAVEQTLSYFNSDNEKPLYFANEEKRIIYSVAMIPNKKIFRKETDTMPAHIGFFSAETIEKFRDNYAKFNGSEKTNINHSEDFVKGVYPIEYWIVNDPEIDKTKTLGIQTIKDSLVMAFKVENNEVWEQCKSGVLDGLSIEARLDRKLINNNFKNEKMKIEKNPQSLWDTMKAFFSADEAPAETEEEKAKRLEEEAKAKAEAEKLAEDTPPTDETDYKALSETQATKIAELEAKVAEYETEKVKEETELTTMKAEKEKAIADLEKFKSETAAAEKVKNLPKDAVKSYDEMTNFEKAKFNRGLI